MSEAQAAATEAPEVVETEAATEAVSEPSATTEQSTKTVVKDAAPAPEPKSTWPEDWAVLAANGDEKKAQRLSRYASPQALADALIESQDKIRSGGLKTPFPVDGDEEAQSRWRTENGIPEAYDKYEIKLDNDMVIGDGDKQMFEGFLKEAHAANMPSEAVNKLASWYFTQQNAALERIAVADDTSLREAKKALMEEWGGGYQANLQEVHNHLVSQFGQDMAESIQTARLPDGRMIGNAPEIVRALLNQSRELNPGAVLVPGASNQQAAVGDRITQINDILRNNPDKYYGDPKLQEEFAKLLEFEKKMAER